MELQIFRLSTAVLCGVFLLATGCKGSDIDGGADCGNALAEPGELCDATDLAGQTCQSQGFAGGTLACDSDCGGFDTSGCGASVCGDGVVESTEVCDGTNTNGETCVTQGYQSGTLTCQAGCTALNIADCTNDVCGNSLREGDEVCDATDLGNADWDCISQGFDYGTLSCLSTCDGYDDSSCGDEPTCDTSDAQCSDADGMNCICEGCNTDGQCGQDDDCVCPDCHGDQECTDPQQCTDDNICEPYTEHCDCADCASHSLCQ